MDGRVERRMVEKNQLYHAMSTKEYQKTAILPYNHLFNFAANELFI